MIQNTKDSVFKERIQGIEFTLKLHRLQMSDWDQRSKKQHFQITNASFIKNM